MPPELAHGSTYDARVYNSFDPTTPRLICAVCHQPLAGDPEDQPDWPGGPLDGECFRAREFDNDFESAELTEYLDDL